jgi:imidazoleglycerol phosphate dehydratase HisB
MLIRKIVVLLIFCLFSVSVANAHGVASIETHDAFFSHLKTLLGQAFESTVTVGGEGDRSFSDHRLVMHVRAVCLANT